MVRSWIDYCFLGGVPDALLWDESKSVIPLCRVYGVSVFHVEQLLWEHVALIS